jgi:putative hydrolase of the HAD superfamily
VKAVVLDFGGPVLVTPFERVAAMERSLRVPPGTFAWPGPFDPAADPPWRAMQAGELSERDYWAARAAEVAAVAGTDGVRVLAEVGCVVDASRHGTRKPEPAAYRLVLDRLGVAPDQAVFVDDQPANAAGAAAAGMAAVWFDVTRPDDSYRKARHALGLAADDGGKP